MTCPNFNPVIWILLFFLAFATNGRSSDQSSALGFEAVVTPDHVSLSSAPKLTSILLALKITNRTSDNILINTFLTPVPYLTPTGGKTIITGTGNDSICVPDKRDITNVPPQHSTYIVVPCYLEKDGSKLNFGGELLRDGGFWIIRDVRVGSYTIRLHYKPPDYSLFPDAVKKAIYPFTPWSGEADSEAVAFTISK